MSEHHCSSHRPRWPVYNLGLGCSNRFRTYSSITATQLFQFIGTRECRVVMFSVARVSLSVHDLTLESLDLQGGPKIGTILYALTSPNINRFSKVFRFRIEKKIVIILLLKTPPHLKCVATLPCET